MEYGKAIFQLEVKNMKGKGKTKESIKGTPSTEEMTSSISSSSSSSSSPSSSSTSSSQKSMGPPLRKPRYRKIVDQTTQSNENAIGLYSTENAELERTISRFPPIPQGEFSFISARQTITNPIFDQCSKGRTIGCRQNRSDSPKEVEKQKEEKSISSSTFSKGLLLVPIQEYNTTLGTETIKQRQLSSVEEMQKLREWKENQVKQQKMKINNSTLFLIDEPQRRRHLSLHSWWEKKMKEKEESLIENEIDPYQAHKAGIEFGGKLFQPNKFFASPLEQQPETRKKSIATSPPKSEDDVYIKSRLVWEAIQDGLITIDLVIALPIDWEKVCIDHYTAIGVLRKRFASETNLPGTLALTTRIENPITLKANKVLVQSQPVITSDNKFANSQTNRPRILLQYLHGPDV